VSKDKAYLIHREHTNITEDMWQLVFDSATGAWSVEHFWTYQETRSRGSKRRSIQDFEKTPAGKRLAKELHAALERAQSDAQGT
jgi:hypothetical protein